MAHESQAMEAKSKLLAHELQMARDRVVEYEAAASSLKVGVHAYSKDFKGSHP